MKSLLVFFAVILMCSCAPDDTVVVHPELAFTIANGTGLTAPRDLTVDDDGNILIFDYENYIIHKFNPSGEILATFGRSNGGVGGFRHLMAIRALGDSILALDAGALFVFDSSGQLRTTRSFADTIVCDLPRIHVSGEWVGEWIIEETAEKVLTLRKANGQQLSRIAGYQLGEFFPGVRPGEMFFIKPTQVRSYVYDFHPDGRLIWAASDELQIYITEDRNNTILYSADWQPCPIPVNEVQAMKEQQATLNPPLFMNVPEKYQLIQHLLVDEAGNIWMYVKSKERTGLVHLSDKGVEKGFYPLEAEFDPLSARIAAAHGRFYFMLAGKGGTKIYIADRP